MAIFHLVWSFSANPVVAIYDLLLY